MKVRELNFNEIPQKRLSIFIDDREAAIGLASDVLRENSYLMDYEIKETNYYFDTFVIRL